MTKSERHELIKLIHANLKIATSNLQHCKDEQLIVTLAEQTNKLKELILEGLLKGE